MGCGERQVFSRQHRTMMPELITHNYDPRRGIARNLCDLSRHDAERVLEEIRSSGTRTIKANYLERRLRVEEWLMEERTRKLGKTALKRPIYFFLGDFSDGRDPSRPASLVMRLMAFRPEDLTFTYPDSMASLPIATEHHHARHRKDYHGHVFTFSEIEAVIATYGMPGDHWKEDPARTYDRFIEVQVWDDAPIHAFLASREGPLDTSKISG